MSRAGWEDERMEPNPSAKNCFVFSGVLRLLGFVAIDTICLGGGILAASDSCRAVVRYLYNYFHVSLPRRIDGARDIWYPRSKSVDHVVGWYLKLDILGLGE